MKQIQSYASTEANTEANTASGLETEIEAPQPLVVHIVKEQAITRHRVKQLHAMEHYTEPRDFESKVAQSCPHDYQDDWHCSKCGYTLTKHLRARIDHVTRSVTG